MTVYDPAALTFGAELELSDVDRSRDLRDLGSWSVEDYSMVNSSGVAVDPLGELWPAGGEVNTRPTGSVEEQVGVCRDVLWGFERATINYRSNLHVHVGVPGLVEDLSGLKRVLSYFATYARAIFAMVEPIPIPRPEDYPGRAAMDGAYRRFRRRLVSHHYMLPSARYAEAMDAPTPQAFRDAHAPPKRDGGRSWHLAPRPAMNLRSLWEHGTIEYRHFPGTLDLDELHAALSWCGIVTQAALNYGPPPGDLYTLRHWRFPAFRPYVHRQELGWRATNLQHHSREEARAAIARMVASGAAPP